MSIEEAIEVGVIGVGSLYALDRLTGKRKRRTIKSPRRAGTVSKSRAKKAVKKSPPRRRTA